MNLAKRIRQLREERNISQSDFGAMCNLEKSNMSRIESGTISPTIYTLYRIAIKLEVELAELFIFPNSKQNAI